MKLATSLGAIVIQLDTARAPLSSANFLKYVDDKRFDGTTFYRAARNPGDPTKGLVQGGIDHFVPKAFNPVAHEPTSKTGLSHIDGTVSMARNAPGSAMGDFFVTVGPMTYLDAKDGRPGYAAFGKVVAGMPVIHKILSLPTFPGGFSKETKGQILRKPVTIVSARRMP
ncbi:peptidylprolyl isomerase [Sphingomonas naphthae]|uniref:peptidylprolyl isomerase n=1 Tax=Sphingomonas naphthae TaxID=1813468 RepID=A0ABY7TGN5_9SPHN|nr:peptidylprolyl isomerase [Sphingomonas naphthae]WCT72008.1 peptidylprolyl isomerase [Sphingomonas naphthae]